MTDQDVVVAQPPQERDEGRPERSLAEQLVEQARADGVDLVGPGGLLAGLTKQVLEAGLEVEMDEHLGYAKHAVKAATMATRATAHARRRCSPRSVRSRWRCPGIVTAVSTRGPCAKGSAGLVGSTRWSSR